MAKRTERRSGAGNSGSETGSASGAAKERIETLDKEITRREKALSVLHDKLKAEEAKLNKLTTRTLTRTALEEVSALIVFVLEYKWAFPATVRGRVGEILDRCNSAIGIESGEVAE